MHLMTDRQTCTSDEFQSLVVEVVVRPVIHHDRLCVGPVPEVQIERKQTIALAAVPMRDTTFAGWKYFVRFRMYSTPVTFP